MTLLRRLHPRNWRNGSSPKTPLVHVPPQKAQTLEDKVSELYDSYVTRSTAEINGMLEMLGSRKRLLWVNFLAGLSRGVGFFLGVTLIGGLLIGATALVLDKTAETLGLKDYTFTNMVKGLYGKFQEVQDVITELKDEEAVGGEPLTPGSVADLHQVPIGLSGIGAYARSLATKNEDAETQDGPPVAPTGGTPDDEDG